jgi:hypothetical protein
MENGLFSSKSNHPPTLNNPLNISSTSLSVPLHLSSSNSALYSSTSSNQSAVDQSGYNRNVLLNSVQQFYQQLNTIRSSRKAVDNQEVNEAFQVCLFLIDHPHEDVR